MPTAADLIAFTEDALREIAEGKARPEPESTPGLFRKIKTIQNPILDTRPVVSIDEARAQMRQAVLDYLTIPHPVHALLVKALPGTGKTTLLVEIAEMLAAQGKRVLWAAPRHDMMEDILAISRSIGGDQSLWYEWLPRRAADEAGNGETCHLAPQISTWMHRGYDAFDFCRKCCGFDYIAKGCTWHWQKKRTEPIILGQHQHIWSGHPLQFNVVIGDEWPGSGPAWQWLIPAQWILPTGMDVREPLTAIYRTLRQLAEQDLVLEGPLLLDALGGASVVRAAIEAYPFASDSTPMQAPWLAGADSVEDAPYAHILETSKLLLREAKAAETGSEYPHRVIVTGGKLMLLLRHPVSEKLPRHVIWLDGTGNQHLYQEILNRPVQVVEPRVELAGRIYQVHDRANGKASLLDGDQPTEKAAQLQEQIAQIVHKFQYKNPGVVTFKALTPLWSDYHIQHFYGARGSNEMERQDIDALFIVATPQPGLMELHTHARMLFFNRMKAFSREWLTKDELYQFLDKKGEGRAYPVSGFHNDTDLNAILWQMREAEIIQMAHRARILHRAVDVWLMLNLPIKELPPTELLAIRELFDAPEGVDAYRWPSVIELAEKKYSENGLVTAGDLIEGLELNARTARKYIDLLIQEDGWEEVRGATKQRGRPPKAAGRA